MFFSSPFIATFFLGLSSLAAEQKITPAAATDFLQQHMPEKDKKNSDLSKKILPQNVHYALKAKKEFPWGSKIPRSVFLNDVLPYATLDETRENWRPDFYQRFAPLVKKAKTVEEALEIISKNIAKELKVKYSKKRKKPNQSPSESMESGLASCTGLSVLLVNACRSVGIPARIAGTPSWTTKRGNHNWVEVFTPSDQAWHFTEYYRDAKGLDAGWFVADAKRANPRSKWHKIYASSWKKTKLAFPLAWRPQDQSVPGIDVTERYLKLDGGIDLTKNSCEIRVEFKVKGERQARQIQLIQGSEIVHQGSTPKATDDGNHFLSFPAQKGQIYHFKWKNEADSFQFQEVQTPKNKAFLQITLQDKK